MKQNFLNTAQCKNGDVDHNQKPLSSPLGASWQAQGRAELLSQCRCTEQLCLGCLHMQVVCWPFGLGNGSFWGGGRGSNLMASYGFSPTDQKFLSRVTRNQCLNTLFSMLFSMTTLLFILRSLIFLLQLTIWEIICFCISCEKRKHNSNCNQHLDCVEASNGVVYFDRKSNSFNIGRIKKNCCVNQCQNR